jgi:hypothetical protein
MPFLLQVQVHLHLTSTVCAKTAKQPGPTAANTGTSRQVPIHSSICNNSVGVRGTPIHNCMRNALVGIASDSEGLYKGPYGTQRELLWSAAHSWISYQISPFKLLRAAIQMLMQFHTMESAMIADDVAKWLCCFTTGDTWPASCGLQCSCLDCTCCFTSAVSQTWLLLILCLVALMLQHVLAPHTHAYKHMVPV